MQKWWVRKPRVDPRIRRLRLGVETLETRRLLAALPYGAFETDLGEFMLGSVAVTPVLLESNGELDANTENWTSGHIQEVLNNIDTGLQWWVDTLATKSTIHELNFVVDTTFAVDPVPTKYEPISRRSNDYPLYVSEFLAGAGFATGNLEGDIRAFNHSQREKLNTDWSFTMFVVPSLNDADGQFAAGGSFSRAFAFAGGLFMVVPSTRPASTFTHETGHIFWARDEYPGGGTFFSRRGYYNTQNLNAHDNPTPGFVQEPSIMAAGSLLETAYDNHISAASTLAMLGWQDSDDDGIFDVLDVPHRLSGTGYLDTALNQYRFTGVAAVQTLPNLNSSGSQNDLTINRIRQIEYRFDGGDWQLYSTPDVYEAVLDLTIPVPANAIEIEIRARDSKTTVLSNVFSGRLARADAVPAPGINGFVWVDSNGNGLRDTGEYGQAGWTVAVVDATQQPLDLRRSIEPDDYPDGVLSGTFDPNLTLTSIGSDADGRIAVFEDAQTSTGSKNFRNYSVNSRSFIALWTSSSRRLQANFATPTSVFEIDAIGSSNGSYGRLEAYDASGQLLARYTTSNLDNGQVETMRIVRGAAEIAYVIAGGHAGTSVKLDNIQFGPETSTVTGPLGEYSLPALPAGSYNVLVTPAGLYRPTVAGGDLLAASVVAHDFTTDVDFGFEVNSSQWQNSSNHYDVSNDGIISALDVLLIINEINANGSRSLAGSDLSTPPFVDVNGDSLVSALDVLLVINFLNAGGEGEAASALNSTSRSGTVGAVAVASPSRGVGEVQASSPHGPRPSCSQTSGEDVALLGYSASAEGFSNPFEDEDRLWLWEELLAFTVG